MSQVAEATTVKQVDLRDDLIKPLPSQEKFLDAMWKYEYLLFGGSAGPGKSYILRWALIELLFEWAAIGLRDVAVGLFCEDYPTLEDRQISKLEREFPKALGELRKTKERGLGFFLKKEYGGGYMALRNLDDPSKYASAEFAAIAVDELTKNDRQTFDDLRFRKRWPGIEHSPFLGATNPGGIGHAWVKKLWVDRDFSGDDSELDPKAFHFIPAKVGENPYLPKSYLDTLKSLPPDMRRAMLDGCWDLFAGQYFSEWRGETHVCEPFPIPRDWTKIIGIDFGFYPAPSAVGWWAIDPHKHWWLYRELYQDRLSYSDLGKTICEMTPLKERIRYAVADPSIWGARPKLEEEPGVTGGDLLGKELRKREIGLRRANNNRINGWQLCREIMKVIPGPDREPYSRLHVFSTCTNFIRTIPSLVHRDTGNMEDLDTNGDDHHADQWRYVVNSREMPSEQLFEQYRKPVPQMGGGFASE